MKCFVVSRDHLGVYRDEVDTGYEIVQKDGFLEYFTAEEHIVVDVRDVIKIYFE